MTKRAPATLRETRERIAMDRARYLASLRERGGGQPACLLFEAPFLAVWLHRWSHYLQRRGFGKLARLLWHLNLVLTGADISPDSEFGGGLLLLTPAGISLCGRAGRNLTVGPMAGIGGGMSMEDIGAGAGLPVVGDDVTMEAHTGILGPVRIASGTRLPAGAAVTDDVPPGTTVLPVRARIVKLPGGGRDDAAGAG